MLVYIDGNEYELDTAALAGDLLRENKELVTISKHGELVFDDRDFGPDYAYRREVWQMRQPGEGTSNSQWAGAEFEFCCSIKMDSERLATYVPPT